MPSPARRLSDRSRSLLVAAATLAAVALAFHESEFRPGVLFGGGARARALAFAATAWPPRLDPPFLAGLLRGALDTVAIAALGTAFAMLVGFPLAVLGSRSVALGALFAQGDGAVRGRARSARAVRIRFLYLASRLAGALLRSIPEVVWAVLFVRILGLGPAPAIAALGVAYGGMLGKVYSEQLEEVHPRPVAAIEAAGADRLGAFAWGILPQALGPMASYSFYRFECAVRASALMGFVGAGGLGFRIAVSVGDSLWNEVVTEVAILVAVVFGIEVVSDRVRRWLG